MQLFKIGGFKQRHINIVTVALILPLIVINSYITKVEWWYWLENVLPFIIILPAIFFIKKLWFDSLIFGLAALGFLVFGSKGNPAGAAFLYLFCVSWENEFLLLIFSGLSFLIIPIKFYILGYTPLDTIMYLIAYFYIIISFFRLTWPKKTDKLPFMDTADHEILDVINREIINRIRRDLTVKEILELSKNWPCCKYEPLTTDTINYRIKSLYKFYGVKGRAGLIDVLHTRKIITPGREL